MALEDLEQLGLQVARPLVDPAGGAMPGAQMTAWRYGGRDQQWFQRDGESEDDFVARVQKAVGLNDKLDQARTYFRTQYANWPSMTAAQKDAANRNLMRFAANVAGWIQDAEDGGD